MCFISNKSPIKEITKGKKEFEEKCKQCNQSFKKGKLKLTKISPLLDLQFNNRRTNLLLETGTDEGKKKPAKNN